MNEKIKCYTFFDCHEVDCPVYHSENSDCWLIEDTRCRDGEPDGFLIKVELCLACPVFKKNMTREGMEVSCAMLARQFREAREALQARDRELESISLEMAIGLSEVFEALKKIASGDPLVRLNEVSDLELIAKLKQMVNRTAEHMSEMVDMTHEFAMGLAEHFDVLHRVGKGDLDARVRGDSPVELLESLKTITNRMVRSVKEEIDHRRKVTGDLQVSEERFRTFAENAPIGITIMNADLTFAFINRTFTEIFGYTMADIPDKPTWLKKAYIKETDRKEAIARWATYGEAADNIGEVMSKTLEVCCKDGSMKTISFRTVVMADGKHFMTYSDISDRIQAEQERRQMAEKLERSKKMEAIGTLAGGVAHDLNNILSGIVSYPELLLMDLPVDSPLRRPISTIQKSGERAAAIVQDLLTLARRGVATMVPIDLNQTITDYLSSPEFDKLRSFHPRLTVDSQLADDLLVTTGSPVHLLKTVMNLVSNAAESMPNGGTITISTENQYVDRSLKGFDDVTEGEYVLLMVSDTGVGIPEKDIQQIFEPFYTKKVMGRSGTGLGMAVVWGTVKDHDGFIDIHSVEGEGTTLTLYFPVVRNHELVRREKASVETIMGDGQYILVVDDVPEQRDIASAILRRLGYIVDTVSSGAAAVDYIKHHDVDLMVLDMIMEPGLDGLETYRQVIAIRPGQKAIVASGFSESERVKTLYQLGVREYLKKPYTPEKIGQAVKRALAG